MNRATDVVPRRPDDDEVVGRCELPGCDKEITRRMAMEPGASAHYCSWEHAHRVRTSGLYGGLVESDPTIEGENREHED